MYRIVVLYCLTHLFITMTITLNELNFYFFFCFKRQKQFMQNQFTNSFDMFDLPVNLKHSHSNVIRNSVSKENKVAFFRFDLVGSWCCYWITENYSRIEHRAYSPDDWTVFLVGIVAKTVKRSNTIDSNWKRKCHEFLINLMYSHYLQ